MNSNSSKKLVNTAFFSCLLAHLSTKCSWRAFVIAQCPASVVHRPQFLQTSSPPKPQGQS